MSGKIVAFVQAKGSSERIPSKNKQILGPMPLFGHAITIAQNAKLVDEVVIDSEDDEILEKGELYGATPFKRPKELASNKYEGNAMMSWAAQERPDSDIILQVMATSPFLKPSSVDQAITLIKDHNFNSSTTVFKQVLYIWENNKPTHLLADGKVPNSRLVEPKIFETQGLYAIKTQIALQNHFRTDPNSCGFVEVSLIETIDIDTPEELEFARIVWRGKRNDNEQL